MPMLTAVSQTPPDYVALAMVIALAVFAAAAVLRKRFAKKTKEIPASQPEPQPPAQPQAVPAPGSAGQLKLHNVDPKAAAMIMAIVAHKMGKPLNELRFISIKEVTEE